MPAKFTVFLDKANKYRFNLKAGNGEIVAASESYPDKKTALKGIASVVKSAADATILDTTVETYKKPVPKKKFSAKKSAKKAVKPKAAAKPKAVKPKVEKPKAVKPTV